VLNLDRAIDFVRRARDGHLLFGCHSSSLSAQAIEVAGFAGLDYVILGMEVESLDLGKLEDLLRAAERVGLVTTVKLRRSSPELAADVLNAGAQFVMAPHITSADELHKMIHASRFAPDGLRGVCPVARYVEYGALPLSRALEATRSYGMVIPIIEDVEALDNVDEIMSVDGVDIIEIGPYDLSLSLRCKKPELTYANPETMEAIQMVAAKARERRKVLLGPIWYQPDLSVPELARKQRESLVPLGITLIYDGDLMSMMRYMSNMARRLRPE
jgi:4-hydroxy-2-oxoheptanedioate aldolase